MEGQDVWVLYTSVNMITSVRLEAAEKLADMYPDAIYFYAELV